MQLPLLSKLTIQIVQAVLDKGKLKIRNSYLGFHKESMEGI